MPNSPAYRRRRNLIINYETEHLADETSALSTIPPQAILWLSSRHATRDAMVTHGDTPSIPPQPQDTLLQRFGATLRQYRQQWGLTQKALSTSMGIRRSSYLSEIEQGKRNITVLM